MGENDKKLGQSAEIGKYRSSFSIRSPFACFFGGVREGSLVHPLIFILPFFKFILFEYFSSFFILDNLLTDTYHDVAM